MEILSPIFNFISAHPYWSAFIAYCLFMILFVLIAEGGSSSGGSSGGGSISSYTSNIAQTSADAKDHMHRRSDAYLRDVRDTVRRDS